MDTSAGAWELKRSIEHRPSPCARRRITEILAGGAQAEVRTRRAREPTEGASGDGDRGLVARGQPYHRTPANIRARADAQSSEDVGRDRDHGQGKRAQSSLPTPSKSAGGRTHYRNIWVWGGGEGGIRFPRTKGHGTDRRGDGGSEPTDMSHGTGPNNEHHPMSAGARPRNREKMWGGTDTTDREGEPNRAILRRPSPWERGRVAAIFAGERIPKSAHKGPRNRSKGRGWTETTDR